MEDKHSRLAEFEAYFKAKVQPDLIPLEKKRKRKVLTGCLLFAPFVLASIYSVGLAVAGGTKNFDPPTWIMTALFTMIIGWVIAFSFARKTSNAANHLLIRHICGFLNLRYNSKPAADLLDTVARLQLVPKHNSYQLEDEVSGEIGSIRFRIQEASLQHNWTISSNRDALFEGLLIQVDLDAGLTRPLHLISHLAISPDPELADQPLGRRIKLNKVVFEQHFEVFSSSEQEAADFLTAKRQKDCIDLTQLFDGRVNICFLRDKLIITGMHYSDWLSSGSALSKLMAPDYYKAAVREFHYLFDLLDAASRLVEKEE